MILTKGQFTQIIDRTRIRDKAKDGSYLVMVDGKSYSEAAREVGIGRSTIHAAVKRLTKEVSKGVIPPGYRKISCWLPDHVADRVERIASLHNLNFDNE